MSAEADIPSALVELIASARSEHPEELIGVIANVSRAAKLEAEPIVSPHALASFTRTASDVSLIREQAS